jgi:hypothetical protein
MGLFDKLFGKKEAVLPENHGMPEPMETPAIPEVKTPKQRKPKAPKPKKSAKDLATEKGEPWVNIISVELDPSNIGAGAFELDWNDLFVAKLVKSGYMRGKNDTDADIVDRWFQDVCRNVVMENFEQEMADPELRQPRSRKLDGDRTEFS